MNNDGIVRKYNVNNFLARLGDDTVATEEETAITFTQANLQYDLRNITRFRVHNNSTSIPQYADQSDLERICRRPDVYTREHQIADLSWHDGVDYKMTKDDFFDRAPSINTSLTPANQQQSSISLNMSNSRKLETFTCFPRLAPEIRLKIWRMIAFTPRVVAVNEQTICNAGAISSITIQTTSAAAKVLQINHESRAETLKFYKRYFGTHILASDLFNFLRTGSQPSGVSLEELVVHANLKADTIYYDKYHLGATSATPGRMPYISNCMEGVLKSAHSIAFNISDISNILIHYIRQLVQDIASNIEELLFVVRLDDGLFDRKSSGHLDLMELKKDEARVWYERYLGEFIERCDKIDEHLLKNYPEQSMKAAKIGRLGGPKIRVVGLMRDGVRI
ncbi:hypothetical protein NHQ30_007614 [Ciborinia camelliae]|nr:hypothetical protein NHQ30_007614 [Ciborinia camelliae]